MDFDQKPALSLGDGARQCPEPMLEVVSIPAFRSHPFLQVQTPFVNFHPGGQQNASKMSHNDHIVQKVPKYFKL